MLLGVVEQIHRVHRNQGEPQQVLKLPQGPDTYRSGQLASGFASLGRIRPRNGSCLVPSPYNIRLQIGSKTPLQRFIDSGSPSGSLDALKAAYGAANVILRHSGGPDNLVSGLSGAGTSSSF